jgi:hypothetical protein
MQLAKKMHELLAFTLYNYTKLHVKYQTGCNVFYECGPFIKNDAVQYYNLFSYLRQELDDEAI